MSAHHLKLNIDKDRAVYPSKEPPVLQCDHALLHVPSPQYQDTSGPHSGLSAQSGPGSCDYVFRVLQLTPSWCAGMYHSSINNARLFGIG